jgi:hypothetical protein
MLIIPHLAPALPPIPCHVRRGFNFCCRTHANIGKYCLHCASSHSYIVANLPISPVCARIGKGPLMSGADDCRMACQQLCGKRSLTRKLEAALTFLCGKLAPPSSFQGRVNNLNIAGERRR